MPAAGVAPPGRPAGEGALHLVRHAPVLAAPGLCYGASELACDPEAQAGLADRLARALPPVVELVSSPRARCLALGEALQQRRPELSLRVDPRLAEMHFGDWEGRPWAQVPRADFEAWMNEFARHRPGRRGESVRALMRRVRAACEDWRADGRGAVWLTHAGVIRAALLWHAGVRCPATAAQWPSRPIRFGEVLVLQAGAALSCGPSPTAPARNPAP